MKRDTLFLLEPDFEDPAYPGQRFYCWHCALMEGVLASFPRLADRIEVVRIPWPQPRTPVAELVGEEYQSVPLLVLADDAEAGLATGSYQRKAFVEGKDAILAVLSRRHDIPEPHP